MEWRDGGDSSSSSCFSGNSRYPLDSWPYMSDYTVRTIWYFNLLNWTAGQNFMLLPDTLLVVTILCRCRESANAMLSILAWAFIFSLAEKLFHHQVPNLVTSLWIPVSIRWQLAPSFRRILLSRLPLLRISSKLELKSAVMLPIINTLNYQIANSNSLQNTLVEHKLWTWRN